MVAGSGLARIGQEQESGRMLVACRREAVHVSDEEPLNGEGGDAAGDDGQREDHIGMIGSSLRVGRWLRLRQCVRRGIGFAGDNFR
jgi:hypothetical protein